MAAVELREITTDRDWDAVMGLDAGDTRYIDPIGDIRLEAAEESRARPHAWAVSDAASGALVGFVMISDGIPEPIDDDLVGPYYLWKLLIDKKVQGRGYGTAVLDSLVWYLRDRPGADVLYTSCADGDGSPRPFYLRYGFRDTGRVMWGENVLALDLSRGLDE
jgi:diamine N-acetyltransferase